MNLSALVVHPAFRQHGAGTMLVDWGIKAADTKGWPVTLCASPMGQLLYQHQIATEVFRVVGEDETLTSAVMVLREETGLIAILHMVVGPRWRTESLILC